MSSTANSSTGLITGFFEWFGDLGLFSWQVLRAAVTPPFEFREQLVPLLDDNKDAVRVRAAAAYIRLQHVTKTLPAGKDGPK